MEGQPTRTGLPVEMGSAHCRPPPASGGWTELSEADCEPAACSCRPGRGDPETRFIPPLAGALGELSQNGGVDLWVMTGGRFWACHPEALLPGGLMEST